MTTLNKTLEELKFEFSDINGRIDDALSIGKVSISSIVNNSNKTKKQNKYVNIEITKKFSKQLKMTFMYANQFLNQSIVQFNTLDKEEHPDVLSHIGVIDSTWRYKTGKAIRFESQGFFGKYDYKEQSKNTSAETNITNNTGSWVSELIEWTPSTHWSITLADQYNYNNPVIAKRVHYYFAMIGYVNGPTRISVSYGRQRQGIFCAGGVCRFVPASSGLSISISSSF